MASLYRLIVGFAGAMLLWVGAMSSAHALVPMVTMYGYAASPYNEAAAGFPYSSKAAACAGFSSAYSAGIGSSYSFTVSGEQCFNSNVGGYNISTSPPSCPANSNAVSQSDCQCNQSFVEVAGQCIPMPKSCEAGKVYSPASTRPLGTGSSMPQAGITALTQPVPSCADDCAIGGGALRAERGLDKNTWTLIVPELRLTGGGCSASNSDLSINTKWDTANNEDLPPSPCATGKCPGTVNGVNVCMPCSASATPSTSSEQSTGNQAATGGSNGDGTGTPGGSGGPSVIGSGGASNSSDTTITTCDGTTCTSTTTSTATGSAGSGVAGGAAGGAGGNTTTDCAKAAASTASAADGKATCTNTTTTTQPQADFCKANPKNASCSNDAGQSSFSGTCAAGFVATGDDAVLNAMAKEQFEQSCKLNPTQAETELAATERGKTGDQTLNNPGNSTVDVGPSRFDTTNALGGGSACPADRNVALPMGRSFTLRMSSVCDSLEMLGMVMMAFSFLLGARIVGRG